jgi:hypothetical protein
MKKFAFLATLLVVSAANAGEIKSTITDSVQLNVQGAAVQSQRVGSSYSVNGTNIDVLTLGTLSGGTASAPANVGTTDYKINATGQAFSFGESLIVGDTAVTSQTVASGQIASPTLFGSNTTQLGGNAGTLAGTLTTTGVGTITAGGPGTTGTTQRSVELSVFK